MARFLVSCRRGCWRHVGPTLVVAAGLALAAMCTSLRADPGDPPAGPPRDRERAWDDREMPRGPDGWRHESPRGPEADGPRRPRGADDRPMPPGPPRDRERSWDDREMPRGAGGWRREGPSSPREQLEQLQAKLDEVLRRLHRLEAEIRCRGEAGREYPPPRPEGRESRPRPPRPPHDAEGMSDRPAPPPGPQTGPAHRREWRGPESEDRMSRDEPKPRPRSPHPPHESGDWDD